MNSDKVLKNKDDKSKYSITVKGSLGLLAIGDLGLRQWRKVKNAANSKENE